MTKRIYNFELPYEIPSLYVHFGLQRFKNEGLFDRMPLHLRTKIETAAAAWEPFVITKETCDSIDDDIWKKIAAELNLDWSKE